MPGQELPRSQTSNVVGVPQGEWGAGVCSVGCGLSNINIELSRGLGNRHWPLLGHRALPGPGDRHQASLEGFGDLRVLCPSTVGCGLAEAPRNTPIGEALLIPAGVGIPVQGRGAHGVWGWVICAGGVGMRAFAPEWTRPPRRWEDLSFLRGSLSPQLHSLPPAPQPRLPG